MNRWPAKPVRPRGTLQPVTGESTESVHEEEEEETGREAGEELEAEEEGVVHRGVRDPGQPSKAEREQHELTHIPFRSWCHHCVRGRGKTMPHMYKGTKLDEEDELPTISMDYCFQKKGDHEQDEHMKMITTLVMKESPTGNIISIVAPKKGREDHVVRKVLEALKWLGNQRVRLIIKSDGEPSLKALVRLIQQRRELEHIAETGVGNAGTLVEEAPLNDSASNGAAEKAVQEVEGHVRTWVSYVEEKMGQPLRGDSHVIPWLVEYVSTAINRTKVGSDGKTPYVRSKGKSSKTKLLPFGEKILWMLPKEVRRKNPKMTPRFNFGIWIGINETTGEYLVTTPEGIKRARTIRRMPSDSRWDADFMRRCKGTPWDYEGKEEYGDMGGNADMPETAREQREDPKEEPRHAADDRRVRRMKISLADVAKHGPTQGCAGCRAAVLKKRATPHSEACRERMLEAIGSTPEGAERIRVAEERLDMELARRLERDAVACEEARESKRARVRDVGKEEEEEEEEGCQQDPQAHDARHDAPEPGHEEARASRERPDEEDDRGAKKQRLSAVDHSKGKNDIMFIYENEHEQDGETVWKDIVDRKPVLIVGGFSGPESWTHARSQYALFCSKVYELQAREGRYFMHEDSRKRQSWEYQPLRDVMKYTDVQYVTGDACNDGNRIMTNAGPKRVVCEVHVMTNSTEAAKLVADNGLERCESAVVTGVKKTVIKKKLKIMQNLAIKSMQLQMKKNREDLRAALMSIEASQEDGEAEEEVNIEKFIDHVNGGLLDPEKVKMARAKEMEYIRKMRVYDKVPRRRCEESSQRKTIKLRWVDTCKADGTYRSRLVAKEFRRDPKPEFFSATPPVEAFKLLISLVASAQVDTRDWGEWEEPDMKFKRGTNDADDKVCLLYSDISRAYFHAAAREDKYVEIPMEDWQEGDEDRCGKLRVSMYGTRDAAVNWEACYAELLTENGFRRGKASTCLYFHPRKQLRLAVHGDDFACGGPLCHLRWLMCVLDGKFEATHKIMGEHPHLLKEIRILNRKVKWESNGIDIEADPKHVEILTKDMDLQSAKPMRTPAVREVGARGSCDHEDDEDDEADISILDADSFIGAMSKKIWKKDKKATHRGEEAESEGDRLGEEESTRYRSLVARLNYLSIDRPDIQFAVKNCAKAMSTPKECHWKQLKRVVRYLLHRPVVAVHFGWQRWPKRICVFTDSDWAGDRASRKSTSGGAMTAGVHLIRSWSKDQSVLAMSSGEAELYAANYGAAQALGLQSMARDIGMTADVDLLIDAKATMGIISRRGLGKVRHLAVQDLWLQDAVNQKKLFLHKVASDKNIADLMTKPLTSDEITNHMNNMKLKWWESTRQYFESVRA